MPTPANNKMRGSTQPQARCRHCGGNCFLEAHDEQWGRDESRFYLFCMCCGRRDGGEKKQHRGYRTRAVFERQGISKAALDAAADGVVRCVFDVCEEAV